MTLYLYFYLITFSLVGYGFIASQFLQIKTKNFGVLGFLGIILLALISYSSTIFIKHGYVFNFIFLLLGIIFFILNLKNFQKFKKDLIYLFFSTSILLIFISIGKNHDDFPYYHFPYITLLTEYSHPFGLGQLNNGFRSPSSIFFISSLFFLPKVGIYLFHLTPALILNFANIILLQDIFNKEFFQNQNLLCFLSLLSFSFINIFFFRLAEHGTDRSGMIIVLLSVIYLINLVNNKEINFDNIKYNENIMKIFIIFICFAATIKPYYLINFSFFLLLIIFEHTRKIFFKLFFSRVFYLCLILIFFIVFFTFINSGCLIFPIKATCSKDLLWSLDKDLVYQTKVWFELWSKGGANPNLVINDRIEYISGLNWLSNWIQNYFFNKVLDFLTGIIFLTLVIFLIFFKRDKKNIFFYNNNFFVYTLIVLLFLEWFFKHPTLRYGGYHLIALLLFIPISMKLSNFKIDYEYFLKRSLIIISITLVIFFARNFNRLDNENSLYGFNPIHNTNYQFIGGNEDFYYRYSTFIGNNIKNFEAINLFGKKIFRIKKNK